MSNKAT